MTVVTAAVTSLSPSWEYPHHNNNINDDDDYNDNDPSSSASYNWNGLDADDDEEEQQGGEQETEGDVNVASTYSLCCIRRKNNRRCILLSLLGLAVMTMISVTVGLAIQNSIDKKNNNDDQVEESPSTTTTSYEFDSLDDYYDYLLEMIVIMVEDDDEEAKNDMYNDESSSLSSSSSSFPITTLSHWTDPSQPQHDALMFLAYQDGRNGLFLTQKDKIQQRLALLLLYHATGGDFYWISTTSNSNDSSKWTVAGTHECTWDGVICGSIDEGDNTAAIDNVVVVELQLNQRSMVGTLPKETFAWLPYLQTLNVAQNRRLSGTIPYTLWKLTSLRVLDASSNTLEGSLPTDLRQMLHLESLNLRDNALDGSLPQYLGANFNQFIIDFNQIDGTIPTTWWTANNDQEKDGEDDTSATTYNAMEILEFGSTYVTGTIPTEIGFWTSLKVLSVTLGSLNGVIPTQIGLCTRLGELSLGGNQFTGHLPLEEILSLPALEWFTVGGNDVTGTIPAHTIRDYTSQNSKFIVWNMDDNRLSGTLPSELGLITSLQWVQLARNNFNGTIPSQDLEQGWSSNIEKLWLHRNEDLIGNMPCGIFTFNNATTGSKPLDFRADCASNENMYCPCCSSCF